MRAIGAAQNSAHVLGLFVWWHPTLSDTMRSQIKLLMHPTHEHRVMLTKMIRDHGAKDFLLLMVVIALLNAIPGMSIAAVCILAQ